MGVEMGWSREDGKMGGILGGSWVGGGNIERRKEEGTREGRGRMGGGGEMEGDMGGWEGR